MDTQARADFERNLNTAFSPHAPIDQTQFFAGRTEQIRAVADTVQTPGLHAAIYGERGVGKTSLANIIKDYVGGGLLVTKVNCSQGDTFTGIVRRSLQAIQFAVDQPKIGYRAEARRELSGILSYVPEGDLAPDQVGQLLADLPDQCMLVIDEFDRLPHGETQAFADFVKSLSDRSSPATVVIVGVADDIDALIASHASVERCLRQIQLPRMSDDELVQIIDVGLEASGFSLEGDPQRRLIVSVSQGFPHFTHLLAQNAARQALDEERAEITTNDVIVGMYRAAEAVEQTYRDLYFKAVTGTKKENLWTEVVAACALARSDERGYFPGRNVQEKLGEILGRPIIQQTVAFHLGKLIEEGRGPLLERIGPERRYRYRFSNPLMRPFIIMKAYERGILGNN